jgi:adenine-specific DNA-methyltransferase
MYFPLFVDPQTKQVSLERTDIFTEEVLPRKSTGEDGRWEWGPETVRQRLDRLEGVFIRGRSEWDVFQREFLEDDSGELRRIKWKSVWDEKEINYQNGKTELKRLFGESPFDYPKPTYLPKKLIEGITSGDDIIIDFFAGSGTTGESVLAQNAADGGERKYILVQLPESLSPDNKDEKFASDYCDKLGKPRNIAELTKERLRRAGNRIRNENPAFIGDTGFRVFKLDTSNIRAWNTEPSDLEQTLLDHLDHLVEGRTESDILYELLLKLGLDLCVPIETKTIYPQMVQMSADRKNPIHLRVSASSADHSTDSSADKPGLKVYRP